MTLLQKLFFYTGILCVLASCGMVGEDAAPIPAYIYVPSYTFVTDTSSFNSDIYQGANSEKFIDMWISDAGKLAGEVGWPSLIPIQKTGATQIWVEAGISITGQDEKREAYPMISQHIETRNLKPGVIDTIYPIFKYLPNIEFKFIEDYDRPGTFLKMDPNKKLSGDTIIRVNDKNAWKPGKYSAKIELDPKHLTLQLLADNQGNGYTLPQSGSPVYIEIDYKSNVPLDLGYYFLEPGGNGTAVNNSVIQTFATTEWKKLYVKLTDEVATRKDGTVYFIYIAVMNLDGIVPDVYIDNVKLVCLKG